MTHHLIALSSAPGSKAVEQHFGRTDRFQIYSLNKEGYQFIETRLVEPCCSGGEHVISAFDSVLAVLSGCEAVVVGKIGTGASDYLNEKGMKVFVTQGYIEDVLEELHRNQDRYFPPENNK
ncbi:MAG: hypothetical protein LBT46_08765 [Planctomycetaceae bacterium]|jgi:predicted Fe-Mo cluster-binding NifX family protein|nr:hypothetical protein [Planctomycetaceae bacterium]